MKDFSLLDTFDKGTAHHQAFFRIVPVEALWTGTIIACANCGVRQSLLFRRQACGRTLSLRNQAAAGSHRAGRLTLSWRPGVLASWRPGVLASWRHGDEIDETTSCLSCGS
jgi:hypothetical protein